MDDGDLINDGRDYLLGRAAEWQNLSAGDTARFVEDSLAQGTQWAVFEPNDEPLWGRLQAVIGEFMHALFERGAFKGATPVEAYFVQVDKSTTTQNDIERGIVNIVVGFAILKPAEFEIVKLRLVAGREPS